MILCAGTMLCLMEYILPVANFLPFELLNNFRGLGIGTQGEKAAKRELIVFDTDHFEVIFPLHNQSLSYVTPQTSHYLQLYSDEFNNLLSGVYYVSSAKTPYLVVYNSSGSGSGSGSFSRGHSVNSYFNSGGSNILASRGANESVVNSKWSICSLQKCPDFVESIKDFGSVRKFEAFQSIFRSISDFPADLKSHDNGNNFCSCTNLFDDSKSVLSSSIYAAASSPAAAAATPLKKVDTLLILTVSNHLEATVIALNFIENSLKRYPGSFRFDVLIIDDASVDGTSEYVKKRGYAVITIRNPKGVTYSWNLGYIIAKKLKYQSIVFANNDVLVSYGALESLIDGLKSYPVMVPMTSLIGAGHNPPQAFSIARRLVDIPMNRVAYAMRNPTTKVELQFSAVEDYCMSPSNTGFIQDYLYAQYTRNRRCRVSAAQKKLSSNKTHSCPSFFKPSSYRNVTRFNGFFFAINLTSIAPAAFSSLLLFDPNDVMVEQENHLALKMDQHNLKPFLSLHSYVFHFKSVTVAKANFQHGQLETRNNLSVYHDPYTMMLEESSSHLVDLYSLRSYQLIRNMPEGMVDRYPARYRMPVIAFAVSDPIRNPLAGDIFTAKEMALHLRLHYNVYVKLMHKNKNYYDASHVDVIVAMLDDFDPSKLMNAKPGLIRVAWMRNWFHRWFSRPFFGNFDLILSSSQHALDLMEDLQAKSGASFFRVECSKNCPNFYRDKMGGRRTRSRVDLLRLATNKHIFRPGKPTPTFKSDYIFAGSYWNKEREVQSLFTDSSSIDSGNSNINASFLLESTSLLSNYRGLIIGNGWDKANIKLKHGISSHGPVPYRRLPLVYRSSKIAIDDANYVTKPWGSINSRVFDSLASGTLVITNGVLDTTSAFSALPTYNSTSDLQDLILQYISDDETRQDLAKRLRKETLQRHTYDIRVVEFIRSLQKHFSFSVQKVDGINGDEVTSGGNSGSQPSKEEIPTMRKSSVTTQQPKCDFSSIPKSICVGVRTMPAHRDWIGSMISSLLGQYRSSSNNAVSVAPIAQQEQRIIEGEISLTPPSTEALGLQIFLANTDLTGSGSNDYITFLNNLVYRMNENYLIDFNSGGSCPVQYLYDMYAPDRRSKNSLYGYDTTDMMLKEMLKEPQCEWILFTNGDNIYNRAWFDKVSSVANNPSMQYLQLIGWNFVTHHQRDGQSNSVIKVKLERRFVDLGSVMIKSTAFFRGKRNKNIFNSVIKRDPETTGYFHRFLPHSLATKDLFARDFYLIQAINDTFTDNDNKTLGLISGAASKEVHLFDEVLMFHQ